MKMKKKTLLVIGLLLLCSMVAFAVILPLTATPSSLKVTIKKFELVKDGGARVTVFNTPTEMDLATVAAGGIAQTFADLTYPAGTYTGYIVTVDQTYKVTCSATITGTNYVTDGSLLGGAPALVPGATATETIASLGADIEEAGPLPGAPVTIVPGTNFGTFAVKVDLTNSAVINTNGIGGAWIVLNAGVTVTRTP